MRRNQYGVTIYDPAKVYGGYTLFAPLGIRDVLMIDMQGRIVHRWEMPERPGCYARLLPNGNLLAGVRADAEKRKKANAPFLSGFGGVIREVDWDGNVIWEYEDVFMHHDFCRLKNGNTLIMRYVPVPDELAAKVKGGVAGTELEGKLWADEFCEIDSEGKVVWNWVAHEHFDPVEDSICPLCPRKEWTHANTLFEMPNGDILACFRQTDTIFIIDKKSGKVKWKWGRGFGNLAHPHDPHLLDNGNYLIFDNGYHRAGVEINTSMVIELNPKTQEIEWEYRSEPITDFYSAACGGAQRLPNGNTLICSTLDARVFEVTDKKEIVWEYVNPYYGMIEFGSVNWLFRAYRYGPDFKGLVGKKFNPEKLDYLNELYGPNAV